MTNLRGHTLLLQCYLNSKPIFFHHKYFGAAINKDSCWVKFVFIRNPCSGFSSVDGLKNIVATILYLHQIYSYTKMISWLISSTLKIQYDFHVDKEVDLQYNIICSLDANLLVLGLSQKGPLHSRLWPRKPSQTIGILKTRVIDVSWFWQDPLEMSWRLDIGDPVKKTPVYHKVIVKNRSQEQESSIPRMDL